MAKYGNMTAPHNVCKDRKGLLQTATVLTPRTSAWGVGDFQQQKNNSVDDRIDETNGLFQRNSSCSAEQKGIPYHSAKEKNARIFFA
jgi:hypothetical protein